MSSDKDRRISRWKRINTVSDRVFISLLAAAVLFTCSGLAHEARILSRGRHSTGYTGFTSLSAVNPDVEGWIIMDGTHIDHPFVRSADNFDYLDKGFDGRPYAGGTLFLDKSCGGIEDAYCIIHGHHMAAGAMFGDLPRYLEPDFFEKHRTGTLLTTEHDYDIEVFAAGVFNAYDSQVYAAGSAQSGYINEKAVNVRPAGDPGHVLALSTCCDDMSDNRVVVFCALINRRAHGWTEKTGL